MMPTFVEQLRLGRVLVSDGATGTNLQQRGLKPGEHPEAWVYTHPERIAELEGAFVEAGSDIILTCTFGATRTRLEGSEIASDVVGLNRQAAVLARSMASARADVLVGGSMGPLGKLLKPYGPLSPEEARAAYQEQAQGLAEGGVDLIVIETQFSLEEARAALDGVRAVTTLPVVVSFSYDRGTRTMMGVQPKQVVAAFSELGATAIGVNCGTTLENATAILQEYEQTAPGFPWWAKPNAGLPRMQEGVTHYDVTPDQMAEFALSAVRHGAKVVGGCCGSTPAHVRAMAAAVRTVESEVNGKP
jgi:5-methyltetrahydrofolate--homocysteine methyltransferase